MSDAKPRLPFPLPQIFAQPQLAQFVFNTAQLNVSESEISASLAFGERQLIELIMPPVVAKTFALQLLNAVEAYEEQMDTKILTKAEVSQKKGE